MNYFEFHLGDYVESTAHLSMIEDGAYTRLMRKYYATERPLPADLKDVHRLVLCRNAAERAAVDRVLKEFFELRTDGWHQKRCDAEIARFHERAAKQKEISMMGVEARRRHNRQLTDSDTNGQTDSATNGQPTVNRRSTPPDSNPQSPVSNHHPPLPNSEGVGVRRIKSADELEAEERAHAGH